MAAELNSRQNEPFCRENSTGEGSAFGVDRYRPPRESIRGEAGVPNEGLCTQTFGMRVSQLLPASGRRFLLLFTTFNYFCYILMLSATGSRWQRLA
jgi:hypothetical protein